MNEKVSQSRGNQGPAINIYTRRRDPIVNVFECCTEQMIPTKNNKNQSQSASTTSSSQRSSTSQGSTNGRHDSVIATPRANIPLGEDVVDVVDVATRIHPNRIITLDIPIHHGEKKK